jgi:hypothetical protein
MTSRFPGPWRITEFPNGFAVYDATGRQLGFFYGRTNPNAAGQTSFLMVDEARQIAVDFTRLPQLLNQTSARSAVATPPEDDESAKLETNCPPQDVPETSHLPRALRTTRDWRIGSNKALAARHDVEPEGVSLATSMPRCITCLATRRGSSNSPSAAMRSPS